MSNHSSKPLKPHNSDGFSPAGGQSAWDEPAAGVTDAAAGATAAQHADAAHTALAPGSSKKNSQGGSPGKAKKSAKKEAPIAGSGNLGVAGQLWAKKQRIK